MTIRIGVQLFPAESIHLSLASIPLGSFNAQPLNESGFLSPGILSTGMEVFFNCVLR